MNTTNIHRLASAHAHPAHHRFAPHRSVGSSAIFQTFCEHLADALLAGAWEAQPMRERAEALTGQLDPWWPALIGRVRRAYVHATGLAPERLAGFLMADRGLAVVWKRRLQFRPLRERFLPHPPMAPTRIPLHGPVPPWSTTAELATGLGISVPLLDGLADRQDRHRTASRTLQNFRRWWVSSRSGRGSPRLIEAPKDRLRRVQREVLRQVLSLASPHPAAHGFVAGCSARSAVAVHAGQALFVRMDLSMFFPSVRRSRVAGLLRAFGFPPRVAWTLACLCTTPTPPDVVRAMPTSDAALLREGARRYLEPHLPQGAPTSPALANLCAYRLDARLSGLARAFGVRYSRYADDLLLSGPARLRVARLLDAIGHVVAEEGFTVHPAKTRVAGPGQAHRALGLVLNAHPAVPRRDRDRLEAILTNCIRHGPHTQNPQGHADWRGHLLGRVAWVAAVHPAHGRDLRRLFDQIHW